MRLVKGNMRPTPMTLAIGDGGNDVAMIFQEPMTALNPVVTVGDQIEEVLRIHRPSNLKERARLCNEVMEAVNLPEPEKLRKSYPHQLSGGQRQSVALARALYAKAKIILMDEPTAALGVEETQRTLDLIRKFRDQGISLLVVSHELEDIFAITDRIVVMKNGRAVSDLSTQCTTHDEIASLMMRGEEKSII